LGGSPAFYYRLDFETPVLGGKLISPHGLDVPRVFGNAGEIAQAIIEDLRQPA
jgi:hypothetical protein